jgi:hypothetical protein
MYRYQQFRLNGRPMGWLGLILSAVIGTALVLAIVVLAIGFAIILLPVIAVLVLIGAWQIRKLRAAMMRDMERKDGWQPRTIEVPYTVDDPGQASDDPGRSPGR